MLDRKGGGALGDLQQVALHPVAVRVVVWRRRLVREQAAPMQARVRPDSAAVEPDKLLVGQPLAGVREPAAEAAVGMVDAADIKKGDERLELTYALDAELAQFVVVHVVAQVPKLLLDAPLTACEL